MTVSDVPRLEARDLEEELQRYLEKRSHHLFAVYGTGDEQTLNLSGAGTMVAVPVRSELELRQRLPSLHEHDPRKVYLVPWTGTVPLDLQGRFAAGGRVLTIGRESRLKRLFSVGEIDRDALASPLADWLLRNKGQGRRAPLRAQRLTHEIMWATWMSEHLGLDTEGGFALDALLAWAATDVRVKVFREGPGAEPKLHAELLRVLERALGPSGPVAFRAWEQGRGRTLLEYALLFEALATSANPAVRMWVKQSLRTELGLTDEVALAEVPASLGRASGAALRYIERRNDGLSARSLVRAAEERVDDVEVRAALAPSRRFPSAFEARLTALGEVLFASVQPGPPSAESVMRAEALLRDLEGHDLATEGEGVRHVERALMTVRLLAWLVSHSTAKLTTSASPYDAVESLGTWYADDGGYVDWARRAARGPEDTPFGRGAQAVVRRADETRKALDRAFAKAFVEWNAAGQPSQNVVPIHHALERIAAKFLEEDRERRLLVLLLDGMAWAQAVELLESLGQAEWGPLAWHGTKRGRVGHGVYPVVLAAAPSITEVSRAAFFASKPPTPGRAEDTQKDRERFRDNKVIGSFASSTEPPTLLLRAESHTKGGSASEEALRLVGDTERRVVAIVVNAIDDSLKGNPATRHAWGVENIASLPDLMERARASGRAVLLASDHGHVPADLLEIKGTQAGGGARWRPLTSPNDVVHDFEVALPAGRVWAPKGAYGVALMADETGRWESSTHAGEHGGATLAELCAPCVLVGTESLSGPVPNDALAVRAHYVPSFWHLGISPPPPAPIESAPLPAELASPPKQLVLPTLAPEPPKPAPKRASVPPTSAFAKSTVLEARVKEAMARKELVRAVEFLLSRNGVAKDAAFAAELGVATRRAPGLVAKFQEALNVDGYEVLRYDSTTHDVVLDIGKLRLLFEVPL